MILAPLILLCASAAGSGQAARQPAAPSAPLQVRLGYPEDAKLLIVNADDLAMSHSENAASLAALDRGDITSATVMVPCPWFAEVAAYAAAHPGADLGLHLTLTSEWRDVRSGPIACPRLVPSLIGRDGWFPPDVASVVKNARLAEVEREIRAQIERAKAGGLDPSHLDAHMHALYATPELFRVLQRVARAYRLPIRIARNDALFAKLLPLTASQDPIVDAIFSPGEDVPISGWTNYYVELVKSLRPGVTEVFVHLANDDAEAQAVSAGRAEWGAAWRQRDRDAVSSPDFRRAIEENHVTLIGWRDIRRLLRPGETATVSRRRP